MGTDKKYWDEKSRSRWFNTDGSEPDCERIAVGCLQRIADAVERMSGSYRELADERDRYKRNWEYVKDDREHLRLSVAALRGVITKLKKKG